MCKPIRLGVVLEGHVSLNLSDMSLQRNQSHRVVLARHAPLNSGGLNLQRTRYHVVLERNGPLHSSGRRLPWKSLTVIYLLGEGCGF